MNFYAEFGGGLGDVFHQIFTQGHYPGLEYLDEWDECTVALISHNPFVKELFEWHPKRAQIEVIECGYWNRDDRAENATKRNEFGLPPFHPGGGRVLGCFDRDGFPQFYPSPQDVDRVKAFDDAVGLRNIVVIAAGAGLPARNIPMSILEGTIVQLQASGFHPVIVGRTYDRYGRSEPFADGTPPGCPNLIDELSVPGMVSLVWNCAGIVCGHSAVNMLGWFLRKPQLLLYPESVERVHVTPRSWWTPGIDLPECYHARFDQRGWARKREEFLRHIGEVRNARVSSKHGQKK